MAKEIKVANFKNLLKYISLYKTNLYFTGIYPLSDIDFLPFFEYI